VSRKFAVIAFVEGKVPDHRNVDSHLLQHQVMVSCARLSAEVKPISKPMPCALSLRPRRAPPRSDVGQRDILPAGKKIFQFHSLWP